MTEIENFLDIRETFFIILEFLLLGLKVFYYICEGVYRLFVPREKKSVIGEIVLVTGAGHGIGRELAIGYASLGATVICWDINKETNEQTMNEINKMGSSSAYAYRCDVSDKHEVFKMAEKVKKEVGDVTILINNAGIGPVRTFQNHSIDEISRVIDVNLMAHYWATKAFLPNMIEKNHGHVVAISSVAALMGHPHLTLYCATKSAIRALMESISEELRTHSKGKSFVKFTTVFPGMVSSGFAKTARLRFPRISGMYTPKQIASLIMDAQRRDCKEKSFPTFYMTIALFVRLLPDKAIMCIMDFLGINFDEEY